MTALTVATLVAAWLVLGAVTAGVMWRRGHDPVAWAMIGFVFGPTAPLFAFEAWRRREPADVVAPGRTARDPGAADVLVGVDGAPGSAATILGAAELLGSRMGRLTVATVVPHDAGAEVDRMAEKALRALSADVPGARLEVLHGRPATALLERALEAGYDVVAVGPRGSGHGAVLGSTARELAGVSKLPVLVVGAGAVEEA